MFICIFIYFTCTVVQLGERGLTFLPSITCNFAFSVFPLSLVVILFTLCAFHIIILKDCTLIPAFQHRNAAEGRISVRLESQAYTLDV